VIANPLGAKADGGWRGDLDNDTFVTHSLRAEGFDASEDGTGRGLVTHALNVSGRGGDVTEDGTGRGVPLTLAIRGRGDTCDLEYREDGIANAILTPNGGRAGVGVGAVAVPILEVGKRTNGDGYRDGDGLGKDGDPMFTLQAGAQHAIAYGIRSDAARDGEAKTPSPDAEGRVRLRDPGFNVYEDLSPTLDQAPHAVAFHENQRAEVTTSDTAGALKVGGGKPGQGYPAVAYGISSDCIDRSGEGDGSAGERAGLGIVADASPSIRARPNNGVAQAMSVRRLLPVECEKLQGFWPGYTTITYRKKPAADGPRYRALGNSMAVPCMKWIGERIAMVEELL
jgi:DNA (cytosine-5)-methyltransferase 1